MIACLMVAVAAVGCNKEETITTNDGEQTNQNDNQQHHDNDNDDNDNHQNVHNHYNDDAHGPDDDQELIDAGALQGAWRAAFVEGDEPLAYFDVFHDEGAATASGDFTMGIAMGDMLDGTVGEIDDIAVDGDSVTVEWNPTTQETEMYTLDLHRVDDDTYEGTFGAEQYPETHDAEMTRQQFDDDPEQ